MKQLADSHNRQGDILVLLGGWSGVCKDGDPSKWKPNLAMVSAAIKFAADSGWLNAKINTKDERQEGNESDDGGESEDEENEQRRDCEGNQEARWNNRYLQPPKKNPILAYQTVDIAAAWTGPNRNSPSEICSALSRCELFRNASPNSAPVGCPSCAKDTFFSLYFALGGYYRRKFWRSLKVTFSLRSRISDL